MISAHYLCPLRKPGTHCWPMDRAIDLHVCQGQRRGKSPTLALLSCELKGFVVSVPGVSTYLTIVIRCAFCREAASIFSNLMMACLPIPEVQSCQPQSWKAHILVALCIIALLSGTVCFWDLYFILYILAINPRKAFSLPNAFCFCGWILAPSLSRDLP